MAYVLLSLIKFVAIESWIESDHLPLPPSLILPTEASNSINSPPEHHAELILESIRWSEAQENEFSSILNSDLISKFRMIIASYPSHLEVQIALSQVVKQ